MSSRARGRIGGVLAAVSFLEAMFFGSNAAALVASSVGFILGVVVMIVGMRGVYREFSMSQQGRLKSLLQIELELARQKERDAEQKGRLDR